LFADVEISFKFVYILSIRFSVSVVYKML